MRCYVLPTVNCTLQSSGLTLFSLVRVDVTAAFNFRVVLIVSGKICRCTRKSLSSRKGHNRENVLIVASSMWGPKLSFSFLKVLSHSMLHNSWLTRRRAVIVATRVRFQASPCEIFLIPSRNRTGFCSRTLIFPCQCHSTIFHTLFYLHLSDHIILAIGNVAK